MSKSKNIKYDVKVIKDISNIANRARIEVLNMTYAAQSGHTGSSLGLADILGCLYFNKLRIDPNRPDCPERDRLILSKGHACPILYAILALKGYFPIRELKKLRRVNSILQGHPDKNKTPGIDMTTGSLGQGLSIGVGMAICAKLDGLNFDVFVIMGDGETNEGTIWEAAMAANKFHLDNLIGIVERNKLQIDGFTEDVMPIEPLESKWKAFNWNVIKIDGHNIEEILHSIDLARKAKKKPTIIIANTIKGRGVSFMENKCDWHGKAPNKIEYQKAIEELSSKYLN